MLRFQTLATAALQATAVCSAAARVERPPAAFSPSWGPSPPGPSPLPRAAEDCELPNAEEPPPEPARVATGRLPLQHQPVLIEAWQFVSRFGEPLLGLPPGTRLPSLQELEAALLGEATPAPAPSAPNEGQSGEGSGEATADGGAAAQPADAAVQLQVALVDFLVTGLFEGTAQAIIGEHETSGHGLVLRKARTKLLHHVGYLHATHVLHPLFH